MENNLDSPHLFWLHNGSVPPVRSLNFVRDKVNQVKLQYFRDDSGHGHYGRTSGGKPKIVRFDSPNIVRHGGTSSFSEEFHIVPIAPGKSGIEALTRDSSTNSHSPASGRTRVLLRQNLPKGPIVSLSILRVLLAHHTNSSLACTDYAHTFSETVQLTTALSIPGSEIVLEKLVNMWN